VGLVAVVWALTATQRLSSYTERRGPVANEPVSLVAGEPGVQVHRPEVKPALLPGELERLLLPLRVKSLAITQAYLQSVEGLRDARRTGKTEAILHETAVIRASMASSLEENHLRLPRPATLAEPLDFVAGTHAAVRLFVLVGLP
jgi:hypothetical protein